MTSLAIIQLTAEEETWLGKWIDAGIDNHPVTGQVVALAPKPGHVWVCDGQQFWQLAIDELPRELANREGTIQSVVKGWTEETLI